MSCKLASNWMSRYMSHWNSTAPGDVLNILVTVALIACMAVARESLTSMAASSILRGRVTCNKVHKMLPTIWCICLQTAFACRLCNVVVMSQMTILFKRPWNDLPINLPPLSWTHHLSQGYWDSHIFLSYYHTRFDVLLSIQTNSTKLVVMLIYVKTLNS